jgi:hypothetical protein
MHPTGASANVPLRADRRWVGTQPIFAITPGPATRLHPITHAGTCPPRPFSSPIRNALTMSFSLSITTSQRRKLRSVTDGASREQRDARGGDGGHRSATPRRRPPSRGYGQDKPAVGTAGELVLTTDRAETDHEYDLTGRRTPETEPADIPVAPAHWPLWVENDGVAFVGFAFGWTPGR